MAFPTSPINGQQAVVNGITYQYTTTTNSWTRIPGIGINLSLSGTLSTQTVSASGNITVGGTVSARSLVGCGVGIANVVVKAQNVVCSPLNPAVFGKNVSIGLGAAGAVIDGVAVGYNAIAACSGVAIGASALAGCIGGIAIGNATVTAICGAGIAIGQNAGAGACSVSVGRFAGQFLQAGGGVAIGKCAGHSSQGSQSIAIGKCSGQVSQQPAAVAIGPCTGKVTQGTNAVAIGRYSGQTKQGPNAVAIGVLAGQTCQPGCSIAINANGAALNPLTAGFFVNPVRNDIVSAIGNVAIYNASTKEIAYGNTISLGGNITGSNLAGVNLSLTGNVILSRTTGNVLSAAGNISIGTNYYYGNGAYLTGITGGGGSSNIIFNGTSNVNVGSANSNVTVGVNGVGNVTVFTPTGLSVAGTIAGGSLTGSTLSVSGNVIGLVPNAANGTAVNSVGFMGMPQSAQAGATYTLSIADMGKHVYSTAATSTITVPANASVPFPIGTTIALVAGPTTTMTVNITTDTMYLAGFGNTGARTLGSYGTATLLKVATTTWIISGTALS